MHFKQILKRFKQIKHQTFIKIAKLLYFTDEVAIYLFLSLLVLYFLHSFKNKLQKINEWERFRFKKNAFYICLIIQMKNTRKF